MPEKIYLSDFCVAVRKDEINGDVEYQLLLNVGMIILRWNASDLDGFIALYKEALERGETIYLPTPYAWK